MEKMAICFLVFNSTNSKFHLFLPKEFSYNDCTINYILDTEKFSSASALLEIRRNKSVPQLILYLIRKNGGHFEFKEFLSLANYQTNLYEHINKIENGYKTTLTYHYYNKDSECIDILEEHNMRLKFDI